MTQAFLAARERRRRFLAALTAATAVALALALATAPVAGAVGDPVASGSTSFKLAKSFKKQLKKNHAKMSPKSFTATGGTMDPTNGTGDLTYSGKLTFKNKQNGKKLVFKSLAATLGSGGKLTGKTRGKTVTVMTLSGGTLVRNGFGADISGITAKLTKAAAKKINKALGLSSLRKGKLGTATVSEQPKTVALAAGGKTNLVPDPNTGAKLASKGVNTLAGGLLPIPPATLAAGPSFDFPILAGNIAPDGSAGKITHGGGIRISRTAGLPNTTLDITGIVLDLQTKVASASVGNITNPPGTCPLPTELPPADVGTVTVTGVSSDPAARKVTVTGTVAMSTTAAAVLNCFFPGGTDLVGGDSLGTATLTAVTH